MIQEVDEGILCAKCFRPFLKRQVPPTLCHECWCHSPAKDRKGRHRTKSKLRKLSLIHI